MIEMRSDQAEQAVIGGLLLDNDAVDKVYWLTAGMLFSADHQQIYIAIRRLLKDKKSVDIVTLCEFLEQHGKLKQVGGLAYIGELVNNTPTAANIVRYAEIVKEKYMTRKLHKTLSGALSSIESGEDIGEVIKSSQNSIALILEGVYSDEPTPISQLLLERMDRIEKIQQGELKPLSSGFRSFDEKLGGMRGGDFIVLAGRPSMGKTALGVQIAEQMQTAAAPALVFTCEMSNGQLVDRMISGNSRVSNNRLFRESGMSVFDWENLAGAIPRLQDIHLFLDDKTNTVGGMLAKARMIKRKHGLGLIVIDYLQLMVGETKTQNREQEISAISRSLKQLAKELDVPVIALSQLSRKVEERQDKRPIMSDLRESGAIEQDADMILFVYRDEYYNPDTVYKGTAELGCAKNRNGETGKIYLTFEAENTRFKEHLGSIPEPESNPRRKNRYDFD